jgi:hypothetical protein
VNLYKAVKLIGESSWQIAHMHWPEGKPCKLLLFFLLATKCQLVIKKLLVSTLYI